MINKNYEATMHERWLPAFSVISPYDVSPDDVSPYMLKTGVDFSLLDARTQFAVIRRCAEIANWAILEAIESKKSHSLELWLKGLQNNNFDNAITQ